MLEPGPDAESMIWRKASYSGSGEHCVELGYAADSRAVRDSKLGAAGPRLWLAPSGAAALADHLRGTRGHQGIMST